VSICCFRCTTLIITLSHKLSVLSYYICWFWPHSAHSVVIACKIISSTFQVVEWLLNHFISKVVHDLFSFRRELLANGPRLCQLHFRYFFASFAITFVLLALILYKIKFSVPGFVNNLSFGRDFNHFGHF